MQSFRAHQNNGSQMVKFQLAITYCSAYRINLPGVRARLGEPA